jgi:hypothetical protein
VATRDTQRAWKVPAGGSRAVLATALTAAMTCSFAMGFGALAGAPAAYGQGNAFQQLPVGPAAAAPTTATTTAATPTISTSSTSSSSSSSGASTGLEIALAVAGVALLGGIAWFIMRDARSAVPEAERASAGSSTALHRQRKQANRARTKAARQQRRRNR